MVGSGGWAKQRVEESGRMEALEAGMGTGWGLARAAGPSPSPGGSLLDLVPRPWSTSPCLLRSRVRFPLPFLGSGLAPRLDRWHGPTALRASAKATLSVGLLGTVSQEVFSECR